MRTLIVRIERIEQRVARDEVPQLTFAFGDEDIEGARALCFDFGTSGPTRDTSRKAIELMSDDEVAAEVGQLEAQAKGGRP